VGKSSGNYASSYYSFTSADAGYYQIALGYSSAISGYVYIYLYSSSDFSSGVGYTNASTLSDKVLAANTTYYVKITNSSCSSDLTYNLTAIRTGDLPNDGSATNPVGLTMGTAYSGKVGQPSVGLNNSYYYFTPSTTGTYNVDVSNLSTNLDFNLYTSSSFSGTSTNEWGNTGMSNLSLTAGITYYLCLHNYYSTNLTYTITVTQN
jgi:hypothetical protein